MTDDNIITPPDSKFKDKLEKAKMLESMKSMAKGMVNRAIEKQNIQNAYVNKLKDTGKYPDFNIGDNVRFTNPKYNNYGTKTRVKELGFEGVHPDTVRRMRKRGTLKDLIKIKDEYYRPLIYFEDGSRKDATELREEKVRKTIRGKATNKPLPVLDIYSKEYQEAEKKAEKKQLKPAATIYKLQSIKGISGVPGGKFTKRFSEGGTTIEQTEKLLGQEKKPIQEDTFFDKYIAGEKTKGMFNPTAKDVVDTATDFIPGVSETKDIISLGSNIGKGDYVGAGIDATSLVLGAVPIAGDVARQAFRKLAKNFVKTKKTDINVSTQDALKQTDQDIENWKAKNQTSPEFQKRLKGRNETLQGMAQGLEDKVVTKKEYREAVDAIRPIRTVKEVPKPATFKDTVSALDSRQRKNPIVGVNYNIPEGDRISARLDITAYTQYDTWIPTLKHEGKTMYKPSVVLKDVTFIKPDSPQVGKALKVATGKPKSPFAVMEGNYVDADNDSTYKYAKKIFKDDDVIQVGYDPTRRGYFYDRRTGNPVLEADEVVQVGHLVLAKKAKLGNADDFFYSKGGDIVDKDVEKAAKPKMRPSNQMELFTYLKDNPDVKGMKEIELDRMRGIITDDDPRAPINTEGLKADIVRQRVLEREELLRDIDRYREGKKELAKGGSMPKQMELFSEGGLKDEGGTVDPVSGNDVPPGSTQEEVRDDIPAQLSEGEFVFPADVVRYIGLEKLMKLRQDAKQGLKMMEEMGQMGNSDEATIPDDLPFDMTDLDVDDEMEYNRGGVVNAQQGTYVAPTLPTFRSESIDTTSPMGMQQIQSGLNTGVAIPTPYVPDVSKMYSPQAQSYAPANYTQVLGTSAVGAPQTELVRYFNKATNQTRMIPHVINPDGSRGSTLYPVPEGFTIQEEAPKEEAKKTKVQTAKVKPVDTGDGGDSGASTTSAVDPAGDPLSYSSLTNLDDLDKNLANIGRMQLGLLSPDIYSLGKNVTTSARGLGNINNISLGAITGYYTSTKNDMGRKGVNVNTLSPTERMELNNSINAAKATVVEVSLDDQGNALSQDDIISNINTLAEVYGLDKTSKAQLSKELGRNFNLDVQLGKKLAEIIREREKNIKERGFETGTTPSTSMGLDSLGIGQQQGIQDAIESGKGSLDTSGIDTSGISSGISDDSFSDDQGQTSGEGVGESGPSGQGDPSGFGGTYKGSLITRKKPKPKKMKRGGLASKK